MKIKYLLVSTICLLTNLFLVWSIGTIGLQEYLTIFVYYIPLCVDVFIIFMIYKDKTVGIIMTLLVLLVLFLLFLILCALVFHCTGAYISSIIALCVFICFFNVFPLTIIIIIVACYFKRKRK